MSYAPARARSRAPWIAILLVPLLALASVLVPTAPASAAPGDVAAATLQWGFKQSFRNYLTGPIAHGHVTATDVDTATPYGWSGGTGAASGGTGTVAYPGTLQFQGHEATGVPAGEYALDVTITDMRVRVTSATTAELQADVVSRSMSTLSFETYTDVVLATLDLSAGTNASTATTVAYTAVPAALTAAGAPAFAGFYAAGTALDPVSFSWPVEQAPVVPTLAVDVTTATEADGLTVSVAATDFEGISASYVSLIEKGSDTAFVGAAAQVAVVDGAFAQTLTAPAASLDKTKQYEVIAWKTRSYPGPSTTFARADVTLSEAQWDALIPPVPTLAVAVTSATQADGVTVSVTATDFDGISASYVSLIEKGSDTAFVGAAAQVAVVDGAFTQTLTAPTASLDKTKQYEVIAWKTRSYPGPTTTYDRADVVLTEEQWNAVFPAPAALTPTVTAAGTTGGLTVSVAGAAFGDVTASYLSIIEKGSEYNYIGAPAQVAVVDGAFTQELTAPTASLDKTKQYEVIAWKTRSNPSAATIYARADIAVTTSQWDAVFPPVVLNPTPVAGSLSWGVKASFRSYVTGPIAHGTISTTGATAGTGGYVFPQSGAAQLTNGTGTVAYSGSVRFTGHDGVLDLRLSDPQVRIDSATAGTLLVRVNGGSHVAFATLALGSATKTTDATGAVRYAGAPATITASGAGAFSLEGSTFYPAGTALDPVTFVVGSAGSASSGTVVVASAAPATPTNTPAAAPPATTGITVTDGEPGEGGELTAEADGFQPNETGILVVIYSTPTVLAENATADADGRVSWTGTLPRGLTGQHTLTFQGSVDRGIVLNIAAASTLPCTASDASLVWGFKESFRAYIDGSIANGEWTTEGDVAYATPVFTWTGGSGGADEDGALDVQYSGSVRFTGHGGVLDTTVANPRVVIDGDRAVLLLDVTGTTQEGEAVSQTAVEFAELDLSGVERTVEGDEVTWADIPATLTAAGAAAFGTYPEGEELDPVTITATVESGCVETAVDEPTAEATDDDLAPEQTASAGWPLWATVLLIALLAAAIVTAAVILVRRRRG
ncbi:HtaA domain-containing protein [Protaetiibacter intestinalis]|uniref:HtaA domain-containing protein n=1 Tax=Protaetiibacter intestinalis TaxID=2419774 RepID=UPI001476649F|nr:HtaA domain-containing protein [Protaetiibacter intestinalis]